MSQRFSCNSCQGVYSDVQADGSIYFHACPPLPPDKKGNVPDRADWRDENLARPRHIRVPWIKSEGHGVKCLTDSRLSEPAWITAMKRSAAEEEEE